MLMNRRTAIDMTAIEYIEDESLIPDEDIIVTLTNKGYIKRIEILILIELKIVVVLVLKVMATNEEDYR